VYGISLVILLFFARYSYTANVLTIKRYLYCSAHEQYHCAAMFCFAKYFVIRFQTCHEASFIVGFLELLMFRSPLVVTCLLQPLDLSTLPFVNQRELITIYHLPKLSWPKWDKTCECQLLGIPNQISAMIVKYTLLLRKSWFICSFKPQAETLKQIGY
jgi:hypothetical protein